MSKLYIKTTQNIPLFFTPAGLHERMVAYAVDEGVKIAYLSAVTLIMVKFFQPTLKTYDTMTLIALFSLISLPVLFYTLVSEYYTGGQTLGKRIMKIRVVKIDGFEATFSDYLTRWFIRLIDVYSFLYVPGLLSMILSPHGRRIGDLIAGTAVITDQQKYNISHTILSEVDTRDYTPTFLRPQVLHFSDNDLRIIKDHYLRANEHKDSEMEDRLCQKIVQITQKENPFRTKREYIEVFLQDYSYYTSI